MTAAGTRPGGLRSCSPAVFGVSAVFVAMTGDNVRVTALLTMMFFVSFNVAFGRAT